MQKNLEDKIRSPSKDENDKLPAANACNKCANETKMTLLNISRDTSWVIRYMWI